MIFQFAKLKDQKKFVIVEDQLQELTTDTCRIFQLYLYKKILNPMNFYQLKTIETLLNKIFQQIKKP